MKKSGKNDGGLKNNAYLCKVIAKESINNRY